MTRRETNSPAQVKAKQYNWSKYRLTSFLGVAQTFAHLPMDPAIKNKLYEHAGAIRHHTKEMLNILTEAYQHEKENNKCN